MKDTEQKIDQKPLAEDLSNKIHYEFTRQFLVKPLDPVMVMKEFNTPIPSDAESNVPAEDVKYKDGLDVIDYNEVKKEVKEVESEYKRGIVLKVPHEYKNQLVSDKMVPIDIKVGDIVIYKYGAWFELLKDTSLLSPYDIIAKEV